ncbi:MAG TPA: site-specific DNA-methyltransferase [Thermopetrobacter sp.]|nr:site-specific DNA-methyltransferase [Thermopetrobacter sp.]
MNVEAFLGDFSLSPSPSLWEEEAHVTRRDSVVFSGKSYPRFFNEFWTARQRGGHSLHEISYRACFKPELPRFFISLLTQPGERVFDPFMGRGTTVVEAALLGRHVGGNDINPLSAILTAPRLDPPMPDEIAARLSAIDLHRPVAEPDIDLGMFYSPHTLRQILNLRAWLRRRWQNGEEDHVDRWLRMVATNRLTGHSSGFFSVYTLPPNQAVSPQRQMRINQLRKQTPPDRDVAAIILKKSRSLMRRLTWQDRAHLTNAAGDAVLSTADAADMQDIQDASIDLIVTSPPFLNTVQYAADNWLRCWFNHLDAEAIGRKITVTASLPRWSACMSAVFDELFRIVKPGGWVAFEVGEVRNGTINLDEVIAPLGEAAGFVCKAIMINEQQFTKTANCWGVQNNRKGTNTNRIVLFQKP